MSSAIEATIFEDGRHAYPDLGRYVVAQDELYRVVSLGPIIVTAERPGAGNHIPGCKVEYVGWDAVDGEIVTTFSGRVELNGEVAT